MVLTPSEGMLLTNGETTSEEVYMPLYGDASAWWETTAEDDDIDLSDGEALNLILYGNA